MIKPTEMTDEEYFKAKGLSKSFLARMDCPDKAHIYKEPTPAMLLGTLAHCAILEPDQFDLRYVVAPEINKRTNAGKAEWAEFEAANAGKVVITQDQYTQAQAMAEAIRNHPTASSFLSGGMAEQAYFWEDENGELCKCKADYIQGDTIVDLKTCADASPSGFGRAVTNFKYHWQDAWYRDGIGAERFVFVAIEAAEPYVIEVYELGEESVQKGRDQINAAKERYVFHRDFEPYIGYTGHGGITELHLPAWA